MFVATTVVGALLAPHPQGPQPSALGDFSIPTAEEGRAIPVVYGTVMIKGGNTVWWGDLKSKKLTTGLLATLLDFGRTTVTGYKYYLGCQFMLCHGPVDSLSDIQFDQKVLPMTTTQILNGSGSEDYIQILAAGENLFGGTAAGGGGGISGTIDFYRGLLTQQPNDYLSAKQGRVALTQTVTGNEFVGVGNGTITSVSAGPDCLDETFTITCIGLDSNPAHGTFGKAKFSIVGSTSGAQVNETLNSDGSNALWADQAFSCSRINITIATGSTNFAIGDHTSLSTQHSTVASAYRGLCYAVFEQLYVGTSNYPKPSAWVITRCPDPLSQGSGVANINGDANPPLVIYDLLTNLSYGLGIPAATIDAASFEYAATVCATEQLGVSMQFDTQASADQLLGEVLRHCDGVLYTDPQTGLWEIKLARADYDASTLLTLTVDNTIGTPEFSRSSWQETTNLVNIRYSSRIANFDDRSIRGYDPANISATNEVRPQSIDFKGLSNATSAALVCTRVLKTLTYPLAKIKIVANRQAWQLRPGGVFKYTWIPLGIENQVFRITRIGYGELTDGKITIDAVEDIFGVNDSAFVSPPPSGWVNPVGAPTACAFQQLIELPYFFLNQGGQTLAAGIYALAMGSRVEAVYEPTFEIWTNPGSGFVDSGLSSPVCPVGTLTADYPAGLVAFDSVGFTLAANGIDLDELEAASPADFANGVNLCIVDDEIMAWTTPTMNSDGTYTISGIARGLLDTVPADHASNAPVFFFSLGANVTQTAPFPSDLTVTARLTPQNSQGDFAVASATDVTVATNSRFARPYPPGNISVNGGAYGVRPPTITGDLTVTWSSRNRLTEALTTQQDAGDVAGETGQSFQVQKLIGGSPVGSPISVGADETFTYTAVQRGIDNADYTLLTTLEICSVVGGLVSYYPQVVSTTMFGSASTLPSPGRYEFTATEVGGLLL